MDNTLDVYISAILGLPSPVAIISHGMERKQWLDVGGAVREERAIYHFDNGVVISRWSEEDQAPSDLACTECLILYDVLDLGRAPSITPSRKRFDNRCQESFWVKRHRALAREDPASA